MTALATQRCLNHATREAVARCPECGQFFCRECIAEHDDRVICAACLRKLATAAKKKPVRGAVFWPVFQLGAGVLFAWFFFYVIGRLLVSIPDEYHDDNMWEVRLMNAIEFRE